MKKKTLNAVAEEMKCRKTKRGKNGGSIDKKSQAEKVKAKKKDDIGQSWN